ncbi:Scr1 family TA system antitoxin-like transcriptional regulator [Streptomyces polygonati]|uniref:Scr1 family TA system antitoxin-like transcriptional regulator n=1 Tax=Streptomyces polygonati TaxID=1617087 RepID=A0ABV8HPW1_9ACTN
MTMETSEPPMSWRYCGNQCKLTRERAGLTRDQLAKEAGYGYETVKSMEQGRRKPTLRLLQVADDLCGAQGVLVAGFAFLKPDPYASFSHDYMRYEAEALVISSFEPLLIPGLLQTEETAQALLSAHWPPLDDETIVERVRARLARQALLATQTKSFNFVIGEAALRNVLTNSGAHKRQLLNLVEMGKRRNITVQVLELRGAHPGLNGPFVLLQTPEHETLSYEEGQSTGILSAEPAKVGVMSQRYAMILRAALSPEESAKFIGKLAEEL